MKRREFITLLGGAAVAWPLAARALQGERMRRLGVILPSSSDDSDLQTRLGALLQELHGLGWIIGRNLRIDTRWTRGNVEEARKYAAELVSISPDVIVAAGVSSAGPLLQATRTVPIVFTSVSDPVAAGLVNSLARPGSNATGFLALEYGLSGKWPELLKEIASAMTRAAVLRDPGIPSGIAQFAIIQAMASAVGIEVIPINMRDVDEIERAVTEFARSSNAGLIVTGSGLANVHRSLIVALAARYKLPAVYFDHSFVTAGGLISYGPDFVDQFRRAAG